MQNIKKTTLTYYVGMSLLIIGILLHVVEIKIGFWIYALGVLPVSALRVYQFFNAHSNDKRRHVPFIFSTIAFIAAAIAIYYNRSYWVIFISLAALLDFYYSYRVKM